MIIKFETFSDWVKATDLLVSCIQQKELFEYLVPLFVEASKSLGNVQIDKIKLTNAEIAIISDNNSKLWDKLEEDPSNKNLEKLVHNFSDICTVVKHLKDLPNESKNL